ncbi:unnamed protein product [Sympodiomycopsis kandeliae]
MRTDVADLTKQSAAMPDAMEEAILNGTFFRGPRTPSPTRTDSTASDPGSDQEDLLASDHDDDEGDGKVTNSRIGGRRGGQSTHTGPKGVIRDRYIHTQSEKEKQRQKIISTNEQLSKLALKAATSTEEEQIKRKQLILEEQLRDLEKRTHQSDSEDDDLFEDEEDHEVSNRYRMNRIAEMKSQQQQKKRSGDFGHLMEVDDQQYLQAVEDDSGVVVVVHIYSKAVEKCHQLTASLSSIARQIPSTKFIQVRATIIGFGCSSNDDDDDEQEEDTDVLPTILVYQYGHLVANLVRVDLEQDFGNGQEKDLTRLLKRHGAFV